MDDDLVVIVGTGRVAPGIAAAFAKHRRVVVAGRDECAAVACAHTASEFAGAAIESAGIGRETFAAASLVVETIVEHLEAKQHVLKKIAPWLRAETVVVSNTSSLALDELGACVHDPRQFAGLHFLHPAHLTKVVEVVPASATSAETLAALTSVVTAMEKRPIRVRKPVAGYIWNRLQMAVLRECISLIECGVTDVESVDAAIAEGLAPRWLAAGPLATADAGGLETFFEIARQLFPVLATETTPSPFFERARADGGFYEWTRDDVEALEAARALALSVGGDVAALRPRLRPLAVQGGSGDRGSVEG